jgi:hypothetical protein
LRVAVVPAGCSRGLLFRLSLPIYKTMISCILPNKLSAEKALAEPTDLHKNGELSDASTPETGDEAASRDDQGEEDQEATSVEPASSAQHGDSAAPVTPELKSGSIVFEKEQEGEDQEVRLLKPSLPGDSYLEESSHQESSSHSSSGSRSSDIILPSNGDGTRDKENNKDTKENGGSKDQEEDSESSEEKEDKDDSLIWKFRLFCGKVVNNEYVQIFIIALIIINAVIMGIATSDFVTEDPQVDRIFDKMDRSFLVVFTIEVAMQFFYLGFTLFTDGWLTFDFLIVILSWSFESLQIVRAFRVFRAFRLFTRVKPLRDLVLAIGAVLPRMYAIGALLLLIFYIFSVLFTELFKDLPLSENYFGTLDASLFTCMELMTLEWGDIVREVMTHRSWAWAPFVAFIALTGFIVFNLIVAVVCDAVSVTEKTVRKLDGIESDDPYAKIDEAQERIDLLQCHIEDMLRTQQAVHDMLEIMAGELLHLEVERMKSELRDVELRIELERRNDFEKIMQSTRQLEGLQRTANEENNRRAQQRGSNGGQDSSRHSLSSRRGGSSRNLVGEQRTSSRRSSMRSTNSTPVGSDRSVARSDKSLGTRSRNSRIGSDRSLGARSRRSDIGNDSNRSLLLSDD